MSEGSDASASSDDSSATRGPGDGLASTTTGELDGSGATSDGDGRTDSTTSIGTETETGTETGTDTDTGADACAPVQPPQLLMDFGDIRLYLYEEIVSRQTFSQSAVDTPEQQQYIEFLEQVDADWPSVDVFDQLALLAHQRDVFVNAGIDDGALWDALIDGSIGEVTSVICLHSIFFDLQNQDFPVWNAPTELAASVLTQEIDGETHIRAYIQTQDGILGVFDNSFIEAAEDDLAAGWDMRAHFHSHPFSPDNRFGDVSGTVIPSDPDIAAFQSLSATHDLGEAWISNGIHSLRLLDEEFNAL